jgi:hypothetical protein
VSPRPAASTLADEDDVVLLALERLVVEAPKLAARGVVAEGACWRPTSSNWTKSDEIALRRASARATLMGRG